MAYGLTTLPKKQVKRLKKAPDHATIARFLSAHFSQWSKKTLAEVTEVLLNIGEISGVQVFIDGTKMESVAGRYTFVWKKAVTKFQNRLAEKIAVFVEGLELSYGIRFIFNGTKFGIRTLKKIRKRLYRIKEEEGIIFVHGCGKKQSKLQKDIKELETYLAKYKEYNQKIHTCGNRSSYLAQNIILAIAHNINKLHKKIQNDRTGQHLFELKKSAWI